MLCGCIVYSVSTLRLEMQEEDTFMTRRSELLYLARKTRLQWVDSVRTVGGATDANLPARVAEMEALMSAMPAMRCLEDVLVFLTELSKDTESVQLASLVSAQAILDDEEDGDIAAADYTGMDSYAVLISKLKRRSSTDVVKNMQGFVQGVEADMREASFQSTMEEQLASVASSIWLFLKRMHVMMRESDSWRGETPEEWDKTKLSLEIFLFNKLHKTLFIEDAAGDAELCDRINTLGFLSPEHLDIKSIVGDGTKVLRRPVEILQSGLASATCPASKVQCLRECSAAISKNLTDFKQDGSFAGADEFLPVLILTIKEANPRQLRSNMNYVLLFTDPARLASEAGYLLTQFVSAVRNIFYPAPLLPLVK